MRLTWWDCPRWWCGLVSHHALTHRFANYHTDASGKRCGCGRRFADDVCITREQQEKGFVDTKLDWNPVERRYEHYL